MVNLFEIFVNIAEDLITISFLTLYFGSKYTGIRKIGGILLGTCVSSSLITIMNSLYIYEGLLGLIFIPVYFLYCVIFLKGDVYTKLFISGFTNCLVYFFALFSILISAELFTHDYKIIFEMTKERVLMIIFNKLLMIASCAVILKFRFPAIAKRKNMLMLILMPIAAEISLNGIMQAFLKYGETNRELLLATIGVMLVNILIYYIFIKISMDASAESERNALSQKYEQDKRYAGEIEDLYKKACGIRHDLTLHFTALKGLLKTDAQKAEQYIDSVLQNQIDTIKLLVKTDNETFDALVNAKIAVCDKLGISVQTRVMNHALDRLSQDEIAVIFGNLFDNAIEASKTSKRKHIELDVQTQGQYLSIFMSNSIDGSVLELNKELHTTKPEKEFHGFGIKNIERIIEVHDGMVDYFEENGSFCCDIYI